MALAEETKYNTLPEAEIFACSMVKKYGECVAVCEPTANLWLKTYQAFERCSIGVKLVNPLKTKVIAEAKIKTDTLEFFIVSDEKSASSNRKRDSSVLSIHTISCITAPR